MLWWKGTAWKIPLKNFWFCWKRLIATTRVCRGPAEYLPCQTLLTCRRVANGETFSSFFHGADEFLYCVHLVPRSSKNSIVHRTAEENGEVTKICLAKCFEFHLRKRWTPKGKSQGSPGMQCAWSIGPNVSIDWIFRTAPCSAVRWKNVHSESSDVIQWCSLQMSTCACIYIYVYICVYE